MTWTVPSPVATGDIYTAAMYNAVLVGDLNHLRGITGGDPGAANLALISNSATTGAWMKVPNAALADQKISKTNEALGGSFAPLPSTAFYEVYTAGSSDGPYASDWFVLNIRHVNLAVDYRRQVAFHFYSDDTYSRSVINGVPGTWKKVGLGTDTLIPNLYARKADLLMDGTMARAVGGAAGNIPANTGALMANLVAQYATFLLDGGTARAVSAAAGGIPANTGGVMANLVAQYATFLLDGGTARAVSAAAGGIPANTGVEMASLWAQFASRLVVPGGADSYPPGHANLTIPIADGVLNPTLYAKVADALRHAGVDRVVGSASGGIPANTGVEMVNLVAQFASQLLVAGVQYVPGAGAGNLAVLDGAGRARDAALFGGLPPSSYQPAGSYALSTHTHSGMLKAVQASYVGDGASGRSITVPGLSSLAQVTITSSGGSNGHVVSTTGAGVITGAGPMWNTSVKLTGGATFQVSSGANDLNVSGNTYYYAALGT